MTRNCFRCGKDFATELDARVCHLCRKPRVGRIRPPVQPSQELTLRERQLAALVAQGKLNKEIAWELKLENGTVKAYLHAIFLKLGVTNRVELAVRWVTAPPAEQAPPAYPPHPATQPAQQ